jgi:hypothetical protein
MVCEALSPSDIKLWGVKALRIKILFWSAAPDGTLNQAAGPSEILEDSCNLTLQQF